MGTYVLHFDGGCSPNPGGLMTFGWHLDTEAGRPVARGRGRLPEADGTLRTNNVAEMRALLKGLRWVNAAKRPIDQLIVQGDSQIAVFIASREWKARKPHLKKIAREIWAEVRNFQKDVVFQWVPRRMNQKADNLARAARRK